MYLRKIKELNKALKQQNKQDTAFINNFCTETEYNNFINDFFIDYDFINNDIETEEL